MRGAISIWEAIVWVAPLLIVGVVGSTAFVVYLVRTDSPRRRERREGSWIVPTRLIDFAYWATDPLVEQLADDGVHPHHITALSLYGAGIAGGALAMGCIVLGGWCLALTGLCDLLDGQLARTQRLDSAAGAFFDSVADRIAEIVVWGGLAVYGGGEIVTWLAIAAMGASLIVSYSRARGQSLGADLEIGLMRRPERLWLLVLILLGAPLASLGGSGTSADEPTLYALAWGAGLIAGLSGVTAYRRTVAIFRALRRGSRSDQSPSERPRT